MGRCTTATLLLTLLILTLSSSALQVTPGSSCASFCLDETDGDPGNPNGSNTTPENIVCNDVDFWSSSTGTKFRNCINCLQSSSAVNGTENDVSWYLCKSFGHTNADDEQWKWPGLTSYPDNLRYSLDVCLFSFPNVSTADTVSSPCSLDSTCLPLQASLETGILDTNTSTEYQYCSQDNEAFGGENIDNCVQCLQATNEQTYLSNFVTALSAGCQQKPAAGVLLGLNGTLFSKTAISITSTASSQATVSMVSTVSTTAKATRLPAGAIAGIAIGVALLLAGGIFLFIFHWRRQKRYATFQNELRRSRQSFSLNFESTISAPVSTSDDSAPGQRFAGPKYSAEFYERKLSLHSSPPVASPGISRHPFGMSHPGPTSLAPIQIPPPSRSQNWAITSHKAEDLPGHPAYIPRLMTRPSRTVGQDKEATQHRSARSSYSVQRYLEAAEDSDDTTIQYRPLSSNKYTSPGVEVTYKRAQTKDANTVISNAVGSSSVASPSPMSTTLPPPPPARSGTPALKVPSVSHFHGPKKYNPPGL